MGMEEEMRVIYKQEEVEVKPSKLSKVKSFFKGLYDQFMIDEKLVEPVVKKDYSKLEELIRYYNEAHNDVNSVLRTTNPLSRFIFRIRMGYTTFYHYKSWR